MSRQLHVTRADRSFKHRSGRDADQFGQAVVRRLSALVSASEHSPDKDATVRQTTKQAIHNAADTLRGMIGDDSHSHNVNTYDDDDDDDAESTASSMDSYFDKTLHFGTRIGGNRQHKYDDAAIDRAIVAGANVPDLKPKASRPLAARGAPVASRSMLSDLSDADSYFDASLRFGTRIGEPHRRPVSSSAATTKPGTVSRERVFSAGDRHRELNPFLVIDTQRAAQLPRQGINSGVPSTATFTTPATSSDALAQSSFRRMNKGRGVRSITASALTASMGSMSDSELDHDNLKHARAVVHENKGKQVNLVDTFRLYDHWLADLDFFYDFLRPCCDGGDGDDEQGDDHQPNNRPNKSHEDTICPGVFVKDDRALEKQRAKDKHQCLYLTDNDNDRIEHNMLPTLDDMRDWWIEFDAQAALPSDPKSCRQLARKAKHLLSVVEHSRPGLDVCHKIRLRHTTRKIKAFAQAAVLRDCLNRLPPARLDDAV